VTQQAQGVHEAAMALTSIARELEGATALFKVRTSDEDDEGPDRSGRGAEPQQLHRAA
jgi:hypothetical protein